MLDSLNAHAPVYLPPPYPSHLPGLLQFITITSPPTYLVGLTTAYVYMYVLFTLFQLWPVLEKSESMTSTTL